MKNNYLTSQQINSYICDGAIIIRNIFKPWIDSLRLGFEKVLTNPGVHSRENIALNSTGRFF